MKLGLVIVDLQNAYYHQRSKGSIDQAYEYIKAIIPSFRNQNLPVIWIQHTSEQYGVIPGKEGFEIIDLFNPEKEDYFIQKSSGNSFKNTNLQSILNEHNVDSLLITGYAAEGCILATYFGALDNDFQPIILKHGIASQEQVNINFVEDTYEIISYKVINKLLNIASENNC